MIGREVPYRLYDCSQCEDTPYLRAILGHDGPPGEGAYWDKNLITGEPLARCPLRSIQLMEAQHPELVQEYQRMEGYYEHYERGLLLERGGIADQPARYLEWMLAIGRMKRTVQRLTDLAIRKGRAGHDEQPSGEGIE